MEKERGIVTFVSDDGDEMKLEIMDYFRHDGQEYAVLAEEGVDCDHDHGEEGCACDEGPEVYIMKAVFIGEGREEFVPVEEDQLPAIAAIAQARMEAMIAEDEDEDDK